MQTSFWDERPACAVLSQIRSTTRLILSCRDTVPSPKTEFTPLIGGWWREEGKGRMVFMAPGHMIEVMNHPMMQKPLPEFAGVAGAGELDD